MALLVSILQLATPILLPAIKMVVARQQQLTYVCMTIYVGDAAVNGGWRGGP